MTCNVLFCYSTRESLEKVESAIKKHVFFKEFTPIQGLSKTILDINNYSEETNLHHLVILEDLQYNIRDKSIAMIIIVTFGIISCIICCVQYSKIIFNNKGSIFAPKNYSNWCVPKEFEKRLYIKVQQLFTGFKTSKYKGPFK